MPPGPWRYVTWATTTVPRTPATAFGILMLMTSPGTMRSRATLRAILPDSMSTVERPGTSVMVTTERSRILMTALPPSRSRANDWSPVTTRSWRNTSSRNLRGTGCGTTARTAVTLPSSIVTTPAFVVCANAGAGNRNMARTKPARFDRCHPSIRRRLARKRVDTDHRVIVIDCQEEAPTRERLGRHSGMSRFSSRPACLLLVVALAAPLVLGERAAAQITEADVYVVQAVLDFSENKVRRGAGQPREGDPDGAGAHGQEPAGRGPA